MSYIFAWFHHMLPVNEKTILLYGIGHFLCIMLAGRRFYQETGRSIGYLIGFIGPVGVLIVYFFPQILTGNQNSKGIGYIPPFQVFVPRTNSISGDFYMDKKGKYDAEELLNLNDTVDDSAGLAEIKSRKVGSGFAISRFNMPVTGGFFLTILMCAILYGFGLSWPLISKVLEIKGQEVSVLYLFQLGIIFILYFILLFIAIKSLFHIS